MARFTLKDTDTLEKIDFEAETFDDVLSQFYLDILLEECPDFDLFEDHDTYKVIQYTIKDENGKAVNVHVHIK